MPLSVARCNFLLSTPPFPSSVSSSVIHNTPYPSSRIAETKTCLKCYLIYIRLYVKTAEIGNKNKLGPFGGCYWTNVPKVSSCGRCSCVDSLFSLDLCCSRHMGYCLRFREVVVLLACLAVREGKLKEIHWCSCRSLLLLSLPGVCFVVASE